MKHGPKSVGKMKDKRMGTIGTSADGIIKTQAKGSSGTPRGNAASPGYSPSGIIR